MDVNTFCPFMQHYEIDEDEVKAEAARTFLGIKQEAIFVFLHLNEVKSASSSYSIPPDSYEYRFNYCFS